MEVLAFLTIVILVVGLQMWVFIRFIPEGLHYRCEFSVREAHEGDAIFLMETVHNRKLLPIPWLKVDIHSSRWLEFAGTRSVIAQEDRRVTSVFFLKSYQKTIRRWNLKCLKRGVFTIENTTLIWGDILGARTNSMPVPVGAQLIVYPEIINLEELFTPVNCIQGEAVVKRWIIDDPFIVSGAREYTSRDSMNRIHWSATAKEGRLMVRKNDFTSRMSLTVLLNMQSKEFEHNDVVYRERIELGIKVAATLLDTALRSGSPARFGANGSIGDGKRMIFTSQASGREHIGELMGILTRLRLKSIRVFENFLEDVFGELVNNEVVLVTSFLNEGICSSLRNLKLKGNSIRVILLDRFRERTELPADLDILVYTGTGGLYEGND